MGRPGPPVPGFPGSKAGPGIGGEELSGQPIVEEAGADGPNSGDGSELVGGRRPPGCGPGVCDGVGSWVQVGCGMGVGSCVQVGCGVGVGSGVDVGCGAHFNCGVGWGVEESWGVGVDGTRVEDGGADVGGRPPGADSVDGDGDGANSVVGDVGNERDGRSDGVPAACCPDVPESDAAGDPLVAPTRSADFCAVWPPSERSGGPANRADPDSDNRQGRLVPAAGGSGLVPLLFAGPDLTAGPPADRGSAEPVSSAPMLPAAPLCPARPAAPAADGSGSPDTWRSDTSGLRAAVAAAVGAGTAEAGAGEALAAILNRAVSKSACSRS